MKTDDLEPKRNPAQTPVIACRDLEKRYGRITALRSVSLQIAPGIVGLLGPNGAGKSTLISVLLGQTPATSGDAYVLGSDVRRHQRQIRLRIGYVPENDCLIPGLSGTGYVYYAGRLSGMSHGDAMQRAHEVLDYVELEEARYRPAEQYSAGMKQRLKLAQALVHDPDLLFLDEPTNGMDPHGRQATLSLIRDLGSSGVSVLLSSHLLPDVERVCQEVVILGGGEVLASGSMAQMREPHPTLYTVEYSGSADALCNQLGSAEVAVQEKHPEKLELTLPSPNQQHRIFKAAEEAGVKIRGLYPKRSSLEEMFMLALQKQEQV